jgi:hypothetical protein
MSSGNIISGLTWARTTTTLTITSTAHGLLTGDYVVLRNFNVDYVYVEITVTDSDTFTAQVTDSGGASGTDGVYIPAFDVTSLSETALTIEAPSAGNCQLMSVQVYINSSDTGTILITLPSDIKNGAGGNISLATTNPPVFVAYSVPSGGSIFIGAAGVTYTTTGNFNQFTLSGGLDLFAPLLYTLKF